MNESAVKLIKTCVAGSASGTITFPEIVANLTAEDIEAYHVDLYRNEATYYAIDGSSHVEAMPEEAGPVAMAFAAAAVGDAVRTSQQGLWTYPDFLKAIRAAGVSNYWVYLSGRSVAYIGRDGDRHVERFPQ